MNQFLNPSDLRNLAIELRKRYGHSQKDVGDAMGISRSNVSNAENNPSSRAGTLVRMIEELSDFQFAEEPRRKVKHNPDRDFSGETFSRLQYHMPMLFYLHRYRPCHLLDLQLQFINYSAPESESVYIETENVDGMEAVRLNTGKLEEGATRALQDLLDEGLVKILDFDIYEEGDYHRLTEEYLKNASGSPIERHRPKYRNHVGGTPGVQDDECWRTVDGEKESLEGKGAYLTFLADRETTEIVKEKLGGVYSKILSERGDDEGFPSNAKFV